MTTRQIVSRLQQEGYSITYYIRKDGGILITSIDGVKYTGAKGNAIARSMIGSALSERRARQLKTIAPEKAGITESMKKQLAKTQRQWRKRFPHERYHKPSVGRPTAKKLREAIKRGGETEAQKILGEWERYASGKAYSKNVEHLASYIEEYGYATGNPAFEELAEDIRNNSANIEESWIMPAYQELYKLNSGGDEDDIIHNVRRILRLA